MDILVILCFVAAVVGGAVLVLRLISQRWAVDPGGPDGPQVTLDQLLADDAR